MQEGEVCDTFCAYCELTRAYTRAKTLTKPLEMLINPASVGQQVLAVVFLTSVLLSSLPCFYFCRLSCSIDCPLLRPSADCLLSSLGPSFPRPLPVSWEISRAGPLSEFRAQTDKDSLTDHPPETGATHSVIVWNQMVWRNLRTRVSPRGFFARTASMIRRIVRICDVDHFLQKNILILSKNFLNFWFDTIEELSIINLNHNGNKGFASVVLDDSKITFFGEGEDAAFCPYRSAYIWCCFIEAVSYWISLSSILLRVFHRD